METMDLSEASGVQIEDSIIKHRPRRIAVDKLINFTEDENQQESDEDDQLIFKQPKGPVTRRAARKRIEPTNESIELKREKLALEREKLALEREKLALEREKLALEREKLALEREKLALEREKLALEREKLALEREKLALEREKLALEREKLALEREKLALEREKLALEREKLAVEMETLAVERERIKLQHIERERKESGTLPFKVKLQPFDPKHDDILTFLSEFDAVAIGDQAKWNNKLRLLQLRTLLNGDARHISSQASTSYGELKKALTDRYGKRPHEYFKELINIKKEPNQMKPIVR
jgi:hypothetical protein